MGKPPYIHPIAQGLANYGPGAKSGLALCEALGQRIIFTFLKDCLKETQTALAGVAQWIER